MNTTARRETAKILQFPTRKWVGDTRPAATSGMTDLNTRALSVAFGSGWYHEAAIQDAERSRRN